jgi:hypothetical protein
VVLQWARPANDHLRSLPLVADLVAHDIQEAADVAIELAHGPFTDMREVSRRPEAA